MSTEKEFPPIVSFLYNQCTLRIDCCTMKINQSLIKYLHIYQCTLLLDHISVQWKWISTNYKLDVWFIANQWTSESVHTDLQELAYLFTLIFRTGVHWKLTSQSNQCTLTSFQCTPVFENQCIFSHWFSATGIHWKQAGVHWILTSQSNQSKSDSCVIMKLHTDLIHS